jgi:hypothetical protein
MEGCSQQIGPRMTCQCRGYCSVSISLDDVLAELFDCVAACEQDWTLMDRIDRRMRSLPPVIWREGVNDPERRFE